MQLGLLLLRDRVSVKNINSHPQEGRYSQENCGRSKSQASLLFDLGQDKVKEEDTSWM